MNIRGILLAGAAVSFCLLATGRAQAQQIFLNISGVPGEVVIPATFAGQIEVQSLSVGASKPCGGTLNMSDLSLMKYTDKATVKFSTALRDHTVYPTAIVSFTRSDNQIYQQYTLTNAVVTSIQTSGAQGGGPRTSESVSFSFSQMTVMYTFFDSSGKGGSPDSMTFTSASCP
jgi:type VI protein secretion system component Hcp